MRTLLILLITMFCFGCEEQYMTREMREKQTKAHFALFEECRTMQRDLHQKADMLKVMTIQAENTEAYLRELKEEEHRYTTLIETKKKELSRLKGEIVEETKVEQYERLLKLEQQGNNNEQK